jgi:hypothetical protein
MNTSIGFDMVSNKRTTKLIGDRVFCAHGFTDQELG